MSVGVKWCGHVKVLYTGWGGRTLAGDAVCCVYVEEWGQFVILSRSRCYASAQGAHVY